MTELNYKIINDLDTEYGTPFYLMYPDVYANNLKAFLNAFKCRYDRVISGYSFKTNYVPALCTYAKNEGCYAEVVSEMEFQLAEKLGFKNIIFNGPIKRESILYHALDKGVIVNLDSAYEVDSVCKYKQCHPDVQIKVGLRVNVMLTDKDGNSTIQCGLRAGRFGFTNDILDENIKKLKEAGIVINSLHGHTSSNDRVPFNYVVISKHMLSVCEKYGLTNLEYFDVGGGFFGAAAKGFDVSKKPSYTDYANAILDTVLSNEWFCKHKPYIVIEPGASVVSNVFDYVTKVYQTKHINNTNFAVVDGSVFDVKPTMHSYNAPTDAFVQNENGNTVLYDVVGSTCMEKDIILKNIELPELRHGDYLMLRGLGAYTICLTPTFINYLAPIVEFINGDCRIVRDRQAIVDVLSMYRY